MKQFLKEFVHNVIVHPMMIFLPNNLSTLLHDKNADWTFKKYENIIEDKDSKIIEQLYLNWINKEFHNPVKFEIRSSAAGYYIYTLKYNNKKQKVRSRQLLNNDHVKIYHAFNTLKELHD